MDRNEYDKMEGERSSIVAEVWKSPRHARMYEQKGKDSKALYLGHLIHLRILQPELFAKLEKKDCMETQVEGFIGTKQLDICNNAYKSLKADKEIEELIFGPGETEIVIQWEETTRRGFTVKCKAMIDRYIPELETIVDLKSTRDASDGKFPKQCFEKNYDIRLAHYVHGMRVKGYKVSNVSVVAVENCDPHLTNRWEVDPVTIREAMFTRSYCLDKLAECRELDEYPGYRKGFKMLTRPTWVHRLEA